MFNKMLSDDSLFSLEVCPPVLVLSPSSDRIYYALQNHPALKTISLLVSMISRTADEQIRLYECDSAGATWLTPSNLFVLWIPHLICSCSKTVLGGKLKQSTRIT